MGNVVLNEVLEHPEAYEEHWFVCYPAGSELTPQLEVQVAEFVPEGYEGLLLMHQIVDVLDGLESDAGRPLKPEERLRAVLFYFEHDAYIDLEDLLVD